MQQNQTASEAESLRLAICQIDVIVGDLDGNTKLITDAINQATEANCDVAIFPELAITGYPPEDLVYKQRFVADNLRAVKQCAKATANTNTVAIIGYVEPAAESISEQSSETQNLDPQSRQSHVSPSDRVTSQLGTSTTVGRPLLYNSAAICANGEIVASYRKRELPNYRVFDEERYFTPGDAQPLYEIAGAHVAVSICEDLWVDEGPTADAAASGAQILLNINASPFFQNKPEARLELLHRRVKEAAAADTPMGIAYVNLIGAQDELIFAGGSLVMQTDETLIGRSPMFAEHLQIVDVALPAKRETNQKPIEINRVKSESQHGLKPVLAPELDPNEELWQALVLGTRDYVHNNGFSDICFGLSGGIDSALVAAIAAEALGAQHVHAVLMPSRYSSDHSISDSVKLCENLGISHRTIEIEPAHASFLEMLAPSFQGREPDLTEQNLQSRIRGVLLMALSNKFGWLVLTTGNKSELAVGYSTLYGDTAGAYAVIKDVWKLSVYELCSWLNETRGQEIIPNHILTKAPSAELRPDQRDDQSLPPYEVLDPLLVELVENDRTPAELIEAGCDAELVTRIARLVDIAEFKRRQSPLGSRVSQKAFGRDRRMPITNRYRGL